MGKQRYRRNELLAIRKSLTTGTLEQAFYGCLALPLKDPMLKAVLKDSSRDGLNVGRTRFGSIPKEDEKQGELKRQVYEALHGGGDSPNMHHEVRPKKMPFGGYSMFSSWPTTVLESGRFSLEERIRLVDFYRSEKDIASCTYLMKREFGRYRPVDFYTNERCRAELISIIQEPFTLVTDVHQLQPKAPANPGSNLLMSALLSHLRNQGESGPDENQETKEKETTSDIKQQEVAPTTIDSPATEVETSAQPKQNIKKPDKPKIKEVVFVKSEDDIKNDDKSKLKSEVPKWDVRKSRGTRGGGRQVKCYKCGQKGHVARNCQNEKKDFGLQFIVE